MSTPEELAEKMSPDALWARWREMNKCPTCGQQMPVPAFIMKAIARDIDEAQKFVAEVMESVRVERSLQKIERTDNG
jgi:hypothetical protein